MIPTSPASVQIRFCHLRKVYHEPIMCGMHREPLVCVATIVLQPWNNEC